MNREARPYPRQSSCSVGVAAIILILFCVCACLSGCSDERAGACPCGPTITLEEFKAGLERAGVWSGGPAPNFEAAGRSTLASAIEYGLRPDHQVLDIGAGSLRVGWWFLQFIEPSNYHAIEPVEERIDTAIEILGVNDINVYHNYDFEFSDVKFGLSGRRVGRQST